MDPAAPNPYQPPAAMAEVKAPGASAGLDANRWARFWGALIDGVITLAVILPLQYFLGYYDDDFNSTATPAQEALWGVAGFAIWGLLHGYFVVKSGQTIGKKLLGTQIVNMWDGRPASFARIAFFRELPLHLLAMIPALSTFAAFVALVDAIVIYRPDRRCVHDHIASTRVTNLR
jgi:uncharacterized RDD family membrane protein YckC